MEVTTTPSPNLCSTCRGLNLRPETFVQTGRRYPTTLRYKTIDEQLGIVSHPEITHYAEGEEISSHDWEGILEQKSPDIVDARLNQSVAISQPLRDLFDEDGDPVHTVPFKYFDLGTSSEVQRRARAGCDLCDLVICAGRLGMDKRPEQPKGPQLALEKDSQEHDLHYKIRFDFWDIETATRSPNAEDGVRMSSIVEGTVSEHLKYSSSTIIPQENGYYDCTILLGSETSASVYPIIHSDSPLAWFGGRVVQSVVDYSLIQHWLEMCSTTHPACAAERNEIDVSLICRLRVIDVVSSCLTEIDVHSSKFVALSYVWGGATTLKVTSTNLEELSQLGALEKHAVEIPNTTKDAMYVVKRLGLRYLWTDSLCILQDDPVELLPQLRRMDLIYALAFFTIVAAAGNSAAAGLPGAHPQRMRPVPRTFRYSDGMHLMPVVETLPALLLDCNWSTRLWTLQEALMSQRLLIFGPDGVHFTCSSLSWSENLKAISERRSPPWKQARERYFYFRSDLTAAAEEDPVLSVSDGVNSMWAMELWITMIMESSERHLGFEWDIANATAGLTRQLETHYRTKSLWGIPECCLEEFLLWSPDTPGALRRRRDASGTPFHPSWSWSGWVGRIGWFGADASDVDDATGSDDGFQVRIRKQKSRNSAPVPLVRVSSVDDDSDGDGDGDSDSQDPKFPHLQISTRMITLTIDTETETATNAPEHIRSLQSVHWSSAHVAVGAIRPAKIPRHDPESTTAAGAAANTVAVASIVFDSVDFCRPTTNTTTTSTTFECDLIQIHSHVRKLSYGSSPSSSDTNGDGTFADVLAVRLIEDSSSTDGSDMTTHHLLAERIGHGRVLCSDTQGMWRSAVVVLQ